jgi:hypothetical protein
MCRVSVLFKVHFSLAYVLTFDIVSSITLIDIYLSARFSDKNVPSCSASGNKSFGASLKEKSFFSTLLDEEENLLFLFHCKETSQCIQDHFQEQDEEGFVQKCFFASMLAFESLQRNLTMSKCHFPLAR